MVSEDQLGGLMPEPIDVRDGVENRRQRAMIEAALFDEPAPPVRIGRFTVVRRLGEGGMGVVYVAYDEELDRRVAVKLLRSEEGAGSEGRRRLQREAQAMARLSHPNVVAVHEVGTFEQQVYVAMELVAGQDLRAWLGARPRPWAEVLACFVQAGEGLAAAHEAGLVHRDFKPDNVLVGDDGRVRVADFGLAHHGATAIPETEGDAAIDPEVLLRTRTGAVLGTPAYMAPEQLEAGPADARSDLFAFCVALFEGLYGQRPFAGSTMAAIATAVREGEVCPAPEGSAVPGWLRAAVLRGLSADPRARWSSMRALLDVLGDDPELRRRRRLRALGLVVVIGIVVAITSGLAIDGIQRSARQRFWAVLNEHLLELEGERAILQDQDAKLRAQDSARMTMVDRLQPDTAPSVHRDPTAAAALLRDVEGPARAGARWIAQANAVLGQAISKDVIRDHRAVVIAMAFVPGAPVLITASADGTVRRVEVETGRSAVLVQHERPVTALALGPAGQWLASGSATGEVVRARVDGTGQPVRHAGHEAAIKALAFSPDGARLASASDDGTVRLWSGEGAEPVVLRGHEGGVLAVAFGPSGTRVLTGSRDLTARLWDAVDGTLRATQREHAKSVFHLRWVDDGRAITAADDGTARLWVLDDPAGSRVLVRHDGAITSLDGRAGRFVTTAEDGRTRTWDLVGGEEAVLGGHAGVVWAGVLTPEATRVVTIGWDGDARVHAVDGRGSSQALRGHRARLASVAVGSGGRWLATGSHDGEVRLWDLERPRRHWELRGHADQVWSAALDPSGPRVATVSHDGTARLWSTEDGASLGELRGPEAAQEPLTAVAFAPDGRTLATGSSRGRIRLWDPASGGSRELLGHGRDVWHLAFDASGRRLASASHDGSARIWDVATGKVEHVLRVGDEPAAPVMVSRVVWVDGVGGAEVITADFEGAVQRWDAASGASLERRVVHEAAIVDLALGPDGRALATASADGSARLWPEGLMSGRAVHLLGHERALSSVAFAPDGSRVVTASEDGTARVWDEEGTWLATLAGHSAELWSARVSADGRWVLTASDDGTIRAWALGVMEGAGVEAALVQWNHGDHVLGLWPTPTGRLVSASSDGTGRLWRLDGLETDPDVLSERLAEVTRECTPASLRVRMLGEDEDEAAAAVAACRAR